MQQTILALGALTILAGVTLIYNANIAQSYKTQTDLQLEIMATGIAVQVMDMLSYSAFDQRTTTTEIDSKGPPAAGDYSEFSSLSVFGSSSSCNLEEPSKNIGKCEDLDDFNMNVNDWSDFDFTLDSGHSIPFKVHIEVFYVDPTDTSTHYTDSTKSYLKKVILEIRSEYSTRPNVSLVKLERVFSYSP